MMERFVQYLKKDRTEYSMIIFHVKRRIAIYAACVELAENVSTVSEYVCWQDTVYDVSEKRR